MPTFDVVSEVDRQEVRNAVDQAQRELSTRFDFKNTNSAIEQNDLVLTLRSSSEDRLRALRQVLEERLVKRGVSLKGLEYAKVEEAAGSTVRQVATISVGISSDKAREINRMIKDKGPKGVSSQTQGDQVRVTGKKRDDLQTVIQLLKEADLAIPLQFTNFRDESSSPASAALWPAPTRSLDIAIGRASRTHRTPSEPASAALWPAPTRFARQCVESRRCAGQAGRTGSGPVVWSSPAPAALWPSPSITL